MLVVTATDEVDFDGVTEEVTVVTAIEEVVV
jgi:hypothetical protein